MGRSSGKRAKMRPSIIYHSPEWEGSGNYVFAISRREIEKIALGLNLPQTVVKGLNDHYVKGCEFEPADEPLRHIQNWFPSLMGGTSAMPGRKSRFRSHPAAGFVLEQMDMETSKFQGIRLEVSGTASEPRIFSGDLRYAKIQLERLLMP